MSQIKGSALIEVFDAKTNKKLYEQKEDNIITHAYEKILQDYRGKLGYDMREMFGDLPSITHALFGGILLFGSVIPSDANHMLPTDAEMQSFVGCASYQGKITDNDYAGEFSTEESEFTDDHAKFVYNFNTAEANGVINTICLTSAVGGYTGYKQNKYGTARSIIQPDSGSNMFKSTVSADSGKCGIVNGFKLYSGIKDDAIICNQNKSLFHLYGETNKAVNLQKEITRKILLNKVNQTVLPSNRYSNIDALAAYVSEPLTSLDLDKLYWLNSSYNTSLKDTLTLHYISMTEPETTKTYNIASLHASVKQYYGDRGYEFYTRCCIFNGKFYIYVPNGLESMNGRIYVVDLNESSSDCSFVYSDLTFTQVILNGASNSDIGRVIFQRVDNTLYASWYSNNEYNGRFFRVDPNTGAVDTTFSTFVYPNYLGWYGDFGKANILETYDNLYLVSPCGAYEHEYLAGLYLPSGYLASINNLQSAINKTAERTLKITYTLTYE